MERRLWTFIFHMGKKKLPIQETNFVAMINRKAEQLLQTPDSSIHFGADQQARQGPAAVADLPRSRTSFRTYGC